MSAKSKERNNYDNKRICGRTILN